MEQKRTDSKKRTKANSLQEANKSEQTPRSEQKANKSKQPPKANKSEQNSEANGEFVRFYSHVEHLTINDYTKGVSSLEISRRLIVLAVARSEAQNLATAG